MSDEKLLSVTSIVNNPFLDFTIVKLETDARSLNIVLHFNKIQTDKYGVVYNYQQGITQYCNNNKISFEGYDFGNDIDVLQVDRSNPLKTFDLQVFNNY